MAIGSTRWGRLWRYAAFAACVALLCTAAAVGSTGAAAGAAAALAGVLTGVVFASGRARAEISDDDRRAPVGQAVDIAIRAGGLVWLGLATTYAVMLTWQLDHRHVSAALVALAAVALSASVMVGVRAAWRSDGVDRAVLMHSAAFSFCLTMAAAVSYALFESLSAAPRLNMWVVWGFGGGTWAVSSVVIRRRMS